jgi:hypothetical protein
LMNGTHSQENMASQYSHFPLSKSSDELTSRAHNESREMYSTYSRSSDVLEHQSQHSGSQRTVGGQYVPQPKVPHISDHQTMRSAQPVGMQQQQQSSVPMKQVPPVIAKKQQQLKQFKSPDLEDSTTTTTGSSSGSPLIGTQNKYTHSDTLPMMRRSYVIDDSDPLLRHSTIGVPVLPPLPAATSAQPSRKASADAQQQQPRRGTMPSFQDVSSSSLISTNSSSKAYLESTC